MSVKAIPIPMMPAPDASKEDLQETLGQLLHWASHERIASLLHAGFTTAEIFALRRIVSHCAAGTYGSEDHRCLFDLLPKLEKIFL